MEGLVWTVTLKIMKKKEFLSLPKNYEPGNVDLINRKLRDPEHHLKGNEFCRILYAVLE